jgi:hypothetical protein
MRLQAKKVTQLLIQYAASNAQTTRSPGRTPFSHKAAAS